MKKFKDYHNLYLKCNVLFLADVFDKFRNNNWKNYGVCPSHYLSAPGLSWDAMLKMTEFNLELILDLDMFIFFLKSARGGISYIKNLWNLLKSYDPRQESKHIKFLDANSFYG